MSDPTEGSAFLYELEVDVRAELDLAEAGRANRDGSVDEQLDPEGQRYEIRLHSLLGAVEVVEDGDTPA